MPVWRSAHVRDRTSLRVSVMISGKKLESDKPKRYPKELTSFFGNYFEKFHAIQLLNAEWGTWLSALFLWIHLNSVVTGVAVSALQENLIILTTVARALFAVRPFLGSYGLILGTLVMGITYTAPLYLAVSAI